MNTYTIIHNPRCRKSREALEILNSKNVEIKIIKYLEDPLSEKEISNIKNLLNLDLIDMLRSKEKLFKELEIKSIGNQDELLKIISQNPILIERPIIIKNNANAVIGRPPENVLELF